MRENATPCTFAPASPADLEALLPYYRQAAARPDCPWSQDYPDQATLEADQAEGRLFCAKDPDGQVMGAYVLTFGDEGTEAQAFWTKGLEPAGEVVRLLTAAPYENQGLGGRLLADAVARLARMGCRSCRILVAKDNRRALRAYEGQGFVYVGLARLYGTDFACFEKPLEGETI